MSLKPGKLTASTFAVGVLLRAVGDAAAAPHRAGAEARITEWVNTAKARYIERCGESIPPEAAQECAQTLFSMSCMAGYPGHYYTKPHFSWPDAMVAADEDMGGWAVPGEAQ